MPLRKAWVRFFFFTLLIIGSLSAVMMIVFYNTSLQREAGRTENIEAFVRKQKQELIENVVNNMVAEINMQRLIAEERAALDLERAGSILAAARAESVPDDSRAGQLVRTISETFRGIDVIAYHLETGYAFGLSGEETVEFTGTRQQFEAFFDGHTVSNIHILDDHYLVGCGVNRALIHAVLLEAMQKYADSQVPLGDVEIRIDALNNYAGHGDFAARIIIPFFQRGGKAALHAGNTDYFDILEPLVVNGEAFTEFVSEGKIERLIYARLYRPYDWVVSSSVSAEDIQLLTRSLAEQFREQLTGTLQIIAMMCIVFTGAALLVFMLLGRRYFRRADYEFRVMDDLSHVDALTGIYNRRYMESGLRRMMEFLSRSNAPISVLMIDIDFFKPYNDTYGHQQGDVCLKAVAQALELALTRENDFVARYGGEEFAVVLPNTGEEGARVIAEKLLDNVRALKIPHEKSLAAPYVTVSVGVTSGSVVYTHCGKDYVQQADRALYASKQGGRNRFTYLEFRETDTGQSESA
ncbi:MAG: GGDEF domain-containing protein [Oscillospiraceae bacterium]|nr:GGDEF domain-containing protein [Oscillospiraceae bacterium]